MQDPCAPEFCSDRGARKQASESQEDDLAFAGKNNLLRMIHNGSKVKCRCKGMCLTDLTESVERNAM